MSGGLSLPVRVRYAMTESTWNLVMVEPSSVLRVVDEENSDSFVVEYESRADFEHELSRFGGMLEYEVLKD